ncbi:MAG: LAGLIDADG family homing endonuclease [Methylophaga sp.]|uniref:LAGLIDADG family homing endonuclease n=1 Tax=Methylophaga sp. TaxID=2024840 RepID=UPI000C1149F7|nr:LAGLIDADG family homing endonuclease [Methylophaga sp.]MBL1458401.1 LAGLIDADG family homing endonuclease [Methylophaga sp.]
MAIYKTTKQLTPPIAAYIAGLIDGEGTVTLCRKHKNENRQLAVSISSTEKYLLEYVLEVVGTGKITTKKTVKTHHSPSFTYAIYNRQALNLLTQISPYLRTYKKHRSQLILKDYLRLTPRNGKYSEELRSAKHDFEIQLLNILPR